MKVLSPEAKSIINNSIRTIPNFPKEGIEFKDITTLIGDAEAFSLLMNHLEARYREYNLDFIAGIDARGFIFGAALADRLGIGFVPIRKKGKLPYKTLSEKYLLEYGEDEVEVHIDAFGHNGCQADGTASRVLLIDDLIATGGTANAASKLISNIGADCVEICFIIELKALNGREDIEVPIYSVLD